MWQIKKKTRFSLFLLNSLQDNYSGTYCITLDIQPIRNKEYAGLHYNRQKEC